MPWQLYPRKTAPGTHWVRGCVGPRAGFGQWWREKSNPWSAARSPSLYRLSYPGSREVWNIERAYGDYIGRGIRLTTGFIGSKVSYTLYNRVSYNYNWLSVAESQLLLSLFRAHDLLQSQLALTGHHLSLLDSSLQLTRLEYSHVTHSAISYIAGEHGCSLLLCHMVFTVPLLRAHPLPGNCCVRPLLRVYPFP
jgi:hypothetical protein